MSPFVSPYEQACRDNAKLIRMLETVLARIECGCGLGSCEVCEIDFELKKIKEGATYARQNSDAV